MRQTLWAWLYALLWWLAPPWVNRYLRRRARKQPDYLLHWDERWQTLPALPSPRLPSLRRFGFMPSQ